MNSLRDVHAHSCDRAHEQMRTPYSHLMTRRIERAKALLRRGDMSVTDVCFAVGCTSLGTFSTRFTELVGLSPSAYRAQDHEHGAPIPACLAKTSTRPIR